MMRLRQIALVTEELRDAEQKICDQLGLEVCYRDPGLSHFGLRHGLYAIGDQLLEVVAPKQAGTTAGRFLERRDGAGGYMVLLQTDNLEQHKERVEGAGLRIVHDGQVNERDTSIHGIHLHPKDVGGAILSLDQADPPESWLRPNCSPQIAVGRARSSAFAVVNSGWFNRPPAATLARQVANQIAARLVYTVGLMPRLCSAMRTPSIRGCISSKMWA